MKKGMKETSQRILLSDEQLDEVIGGAQSAQRPSWLRG